MVRGTVPLIEWPPVVGVNRTKIVDIRLMTEPQKRILWEGIKRVNPKLAARLRADPHLIQMQHDLGGEPAFGVEEFNRYIQAGLKTGFRRRKI